MKTRLAACVAASVAAWVVPASLAAQTPPALALSQPPPVLTLSQAIGEALVKNDRLIDQHDAIEQADLDLRLARSAFQPKVTPNIYGSFGRTDVSNQTYRVDLAQRFVTGTEVRLWAATATDQIPGQPGTSEGDVRFYNTDTTLTLSQPLLRGFGRAVARRPLTSAELRRAHADRTQALAEQQVAIDVASAYYRVVAQQAFADVTRQSLGRARTLQDASEAKLDAGLVSRLDVLRARQLVAQAEIRFFDAQSAIDDARDQLRFLIGRESTSTVVVEGDIPRPDPAPLDADVAVAIALRNRLDLRSRAEDATDADRQVQFARNQLLPQVDVNLALTRRETSNGFAQGFGLGGFQFATFFTVAMPVDRTAAQVVFQNGLIDRDRRRRDLTTFERQIADDVKRAIRERDRALRSVASAETTVEIGRQEVEVAQLRYERGLSNNLDVVAAETSLLQAETRRIQALADSAIVRLRLRALLGILNPRTDAVGSAIWDATDPIR